MGGNMGIAFSVGQGAFGGSRLRKTLLKHFGIPAGQIATAGRQFPITARVDIQSALEDLLKVRPRTTLFGITSVHPQQLPSLADTLAGAHFPVDAGPLQYDEIDVGEPIPVRCLKNGLWMSSDGDLPFAVILAPGGRLDCGPACKWKLPFRPASAAHSFRRSSSVSWNSWSQRAALTEAASFPWRPTSTQWVAAARSRYTVWPKSIATTLSCRQKLWRFSITTSLDS